MNDIPQSGPERDAYAIKVMQMASRAEGGQCLNVQRSPRGKSKWVTTYGQWNWATFDYRIVEHEVVMWAYGYVNGSISNFFHKKRDIYNNRSVVDVTHYIKRTTGGGRTIPQYEAVPLE